LTQGALALELFDSHCHLEDPVYDKDRATVLERARRASVKRLLTVGTDRLTSERALELAVANAGVYASIGVHPHAAATCSEATLERLRALAGHPKVRAWGEIGLDFNRLHSPKKDQERWFVRQVQVAAELNLPLIFHERDSGGRFLELLERHLGKEIRGVVHCFSGTLAELERYLAAGLYIGITGIVTLQTRGDTLRQLAPRISTERLLIETDAPYLTPAPERNHYRRNEPAFVRSVLFKLAEARDESPESLARTIWNNTLRLFTPKDQTG
jgi:TatD DNase family protein